MSQQPDSKPAAAPTRLAPQPPTGLRIDFDSDIPVMWLFEELATLGLVVSNSLATGHLKATLSPRMREILNRRIEALQKSPSEIARRRELDAGREP